MATQTIGEIRWALPQAYWVGTLREREPQRGPTLVG